MTGRHARTRTEQAKLHTMEQARAEALAHAHPAVLPSPEPASPEPEHNMTPGNVWCRACGGVVWNNPGLQPR